MPSEIMPSFVQELSKYAIFSEVTISNIQHLTETRDQEHYAIMQKLPLVYLATQFKFLPHDLRLPELKIVSFTKGCFKGQEIIARMEHRGKIKRKTYIIAHEKAVEIGAPILALGVEVGNVVRSSQGLSLAVITESYLSEILTIQQQLIKVIS